MNVTACNDDFRRLERLSPLGYFAMGVGWIFVSHDDNGEPRSERMLAIANGSDWTPQPLTLHASSARRGFEKLPCWFSDDYDHHMGLAVGDITGNGYDDIVVAVFSGRDQNLAEGGVKVYLGGPDGLNPSPVWIARGFAATGVALADFGSTGFPDIVVSCLTESGSIQAPKLDENGTFQGRARFLENHTVRGSTQPEFSVRIIEHEAARGAGDVSVADVDLDGTLDVIFAGNRTAVLYGDPETGNGAPWENAPAWLSEEAHPFSFTAQAFTHPRFPGQQLIASSRGLFSVEQLQGRSLSEVSPGILIHRPIREGKTHALQELAKVNPKRPEIPAGLAIAHDPDGMPCLIAGFLDARGRDIRGAPLRMFRAEEGGSHDARMPFENSRGTPLPGGGLMAGRVIATPRPEGPTSISVCQIDAGKDPMRVATLPWRPTGDLLCVDAKDRDGRFIDVAYSRTSDGSTLCFHPPLPPYSRVSVSVRTAEEIDIAATSSAAWPPAGASGVWRGRFSRSDSLRQPSSSAAVKQAG